MKKVKYKKHKKYFVKSFDGLLETNYDFFNSVDSWIKALSIGMSCYKEIHYVLIKDSDGEDSYIGNMKVITGLERTLQELNERYPQLMSEIHKISKVSC